MLCQIRVKNNGSGEILISVCRALLHGIFVPFYPRGLFTYVFAYFAAGELFACSFIFLRLGMNLSRRCRNAKALKSAMKEMNKDSKGEMKFMDYTYIKGFQQEDALMKSYFEYTQCVFGFELAKWRAEGFWQSQYIPHSFECSGRIIANVSASIMKVQIQGKEIDAVQLGSVGVLPEYRGEGLARLLLEKVLQEYREYPLIFLFAGEDVWEFYSKFGFKGTMETIPYRMVQGRGESLEAEKLTLESSHIKRLLESRLQGSSILDARGNQSIYWFHLMYIFGDCLYYIKEKDIVFIAKQNGEEVNVYDVLSTNPVTFDDIKGYLLKDGVEKVRFHFTPDWLVDSYELETLQEDKIFVLGAFPEDLKGYKFPKTAIT